MKTIIFLSVATIGMSTDNFLVMSGALLICGILIFKKNKMEKEIRQLEFEYVLSSLELLISIEEFNQNEYKLKKLNEFKEYLKKWENETTK
jgi:hypothetical protein